MRILMVTGIFPPDTGGPASYVPRMAAELTQRGHQLAVVCLSDSLAHDDSRYPFPVQRVRRGLFKPGRALLTLWTVWRLALRSDLVYINGLSVEAQSAALLAGAPTVHKIVGDYAWERARNRGWYQGSIEQYQTAPKGWVLRLLDLIRTAPLLPARQVIVPSAYLKGIVTGWGILPEKVRVVYNAVDLPAGQASPEPLPPWDGPTLVTVCRLVPWKGVDGILRAAKDLPGSRLVIVGDGPLRSDLERLAAELGLAGRTIFTGNVSKEAVAAYLAQADLFILNSSYEGLPHVVLEAMSAGVAVVATDAGGTHEVVQHGKNGLLVPVNDDGALRIAIAALLGDVGLRRRLVEQARTEVAAAWSREAMVSQTEATLQEFGRRGR